MIKRIYYWFHQLISRPWERREISGGYWPGLVRTQALILCKGISGRILEIGCGEGLFLTQLAKENPNLEIWGIDDNPAMLEEAEGKYKREDFKNINLSLQEASNLSFKDEYFDTVVCINTFYNVESIDLVKQMLNEMRRVCKKGGKIIFDFRNSMNPLLRVKYKLARYYDDTLRVKNLPLKTYNPKQIEEILKDLGLNIINRRFIGLPLNRFAPIIIIEAEKVCSQNESPSPIPLPRVGEG